MGVSGGVSRTSKVRAQPVVGTKLASRGDPKGHPAHQGIKFIVETTARPCFDERYRPMTKQEYRLIDVHHDEPILKAFMLFVQSAHAVLKYADAHFYREARLSLIKYMVLHILSTNGGTLTPSEIAQRTLTVRSNITALADRMKRDGLISTKRNRRDKRLVNIRLTNKGRNVLTQATPLARDIANQVMLSMSEGDAVVLDRLLRVLRQNAHPG